MERRPRKLLAELKQGMESDMNNINIPAGSSSRRDLRAPSPEGLAGRGGSGRGREPRRCGARSSYSHAPRPSGARKHPRHIPDLSDLTSTLRRSNGPAVRDRRRFSGLRPSAFELSAAEQLRTIVALMSCIVSGIIGYAAVFKGPARFGEIP
ncbi:hypothetical protein VTN02DRAFT_2128 [Thermoascus thermophilus]